MNTRITVQDIRDALEALRPREGPAEQSYGLPLHPFQWADGCIRPKGWFSRLVWRFIRWQYVVPDLGDNDTPYISENIGNPWEEKP